MKMTHLSRTRQDRATTLRFKFAALALLAAPLTALAQGFKQTEDELCGFLGNITTLLNMGSIAVVTIAIIFAGYQIAFAHKRISDVAPILIGALLIGAAAQIARMIIGTDGGECGTGTPGGMAMMLDALKTYHA